MGGILGKLVNTVTGGTLDKVIDRVLPGKISQAEKLKLQQEMELELLRSQTTIIEAEAKSDDKFVSRARPTFLYIGYAVLVFNYILLPLMQMVGSCFGGYPVQAFTVLNLPEGFWYLFGTGYLGYTGFRSMDKKDIFKSFMQKTQ